MNVKVLSIKPSRNSENFQVTAYIIGTERHEFTMTVETDTIAGEKINLIKGDKNFCHIFRFNQNVAIALYELVSKVNRGQSVELPAEIGNFAALEIERLSFEKAALAQ